MRHAGEGFPGYSRRRRFSSEERGVLSEELARRVGCAGRRLLSRRARGYSRATVGSYRKRVGPRGRKQQDWTRTGGTLEAGQSGGAGGPCRGETLVRADGIEPTIRFQLIVLSYLPLKRYFVGYH